MQNALTAEKPESQHPAWQSQAHQRPAEVSCALNITDRGHSEQLQIITMSDYGFEDRW